MKRAWALPLLLVFSIAAAGEERRVPSIEDLLGLETVGGVQISPDGKWVAYTVSGSDFEQDTYVTQIWLADSDSQETFQLTRGKASASSPRWSPDGTWLAFASSRSEEKRQLFVIRPTRNEAICLTESRPPDLSPLSTCNR